MKILHKLKNDFSVCSHALGKSHLTQQARLITAAAVQYCLQIKGVQIDKIDQIGGRHLQLFVDHQLQFLAPRTVANQMAHIREFLRASDKKSLADDPNFSNAALGIPVASRIGTKTPLTAEQVEELKQQAISRRRPGHGSGIELQFVLGLRAEEVVQASAAVLSSWLVELGHGDAISVSEGTKGGYVRQTHVPNKLLAVIAIKAALELAKKQGGFLIQQKSSRKLSLKQAVTAYCGYFQRLRVQTHAARYAFAMISIEAYIAAGMSEKDALSRTARDLGHGPGRGRWVKSVYAASRMAKVDAKK